MGKLDIGQLGSWDKSCVGPATRVHINGCIDACKYAEIFGNNLHPIVYNG